MSQAGFQYKNKNELDNQNINNYSKSPLSSNPPTALQNPVSQKPAQTFGVPIKQQDPQNQNTADNIESANFEYAGIGQRAMAGFLDGIFLSIITFIISFPFSYVFALMFYNLPEDPSFDPSAFSFLPDLGQFLSFAVSLIYPVYFIAKKGATPGKMIMKIKVVRKNEQDKELGFTSAFVREIVGKFISAIALGLGYLWALWDRDKKTWHDKIAGTVVVKV